MAKDKQTTEELLKWAEGVCFIEICVGGETEVQMMYDDFETRYQDCTLRRAILRAQREERKKTNLIFLGVEIK